MNESRKSTKKPIKNLPKVYQESGKICPKFVLGVRLGGSGRHLGAKSHQDPPTPGKIEKAYLAPRWFEIPPKNRRNSGQNCDQKVDCFLNNFSFGVDESRDVFASILPLSWSADDLKNVEDIQFPFFCYLGQVANKQ